MALDRLLDDPQWQVVGLLTTITAQFDRVAMHGILRDVLRAQAEALGLPLIESELEYPASNEVYERAFAASLHAARATNPDLNHVAFGDLFLADLRTWRETLLKRLDWHAVFPLWHEPTAILARRFHAAGHRAVLTCVDTTQLAADFSGRNFDPALLDELPVEADPCGEHGEFHTLSYAGPRFRQPLHLQRGENVLRDGRFQYSDFLLDPGPW